jgi:hypothetical protein
MSERNYRTVYPVLHDGVSYNPGDIIALTDEQSSPLERSGAVQAIDADDAPPDAPPRDDDAPDGDAPVRKRRKARGA